MATFFSNQITLARSGQNQNASDCGGGGRGAAWDITLPSSGLGIGDVLVLQVLPPNVRIAGGQEWHGALGAGTFNIGTYSLAPDGTPTVINATAFASGLSCATGANALPTLASAGSGGRYRTGGTEYVCATNVGTAFAVSQQLFGWLSYM